MKKAVVAIMLILAVAVLSGCTVNMPGVGKVHVPLLPARHPSPTPTVSTVALATATPTAAPSATPTAAPTSTPEPTSTPVPTSSPTPTATATPRPTFTPTATATATPTATPTPAVEIRRDMNLRAGPGTVYPVVGHAKKGQVLPVEARWGTWYRVAEGKWIYGGKGLAEPNAGAKTAPVARKIPPTPTPRPTPTPKPKPTTAPSSNLPPMQDVVVLGPNTKYPVRARVFRGWGYEIVDNSKKWDVVLYRDVLGYVLHKATHPDGTPLFDWNKYPAGVRITIIDPIVNVHCKPDPQVPVYSEAPIQITNLYGNNECWNWSLPASNGDGTGGEISYGCTLGVYHNPRECFIAVHSQGKCAECLSGLVISTFHDMLAKRVYEPKDFSKPPYDAMGKATRDPKTGQWRWQNPFLRIVPAAP